MTVEANSRPPIHQRNDGIDFRRVAIQVELFQAVMNLTPPAIPSPARFLARDRGARPNPRPDRRSRWDVCAESRLVPWDRSLLPNITSRHVPCAGRVRLLLVRLL